MKPIYKSKTVLGAIAMLCLVIVDHSLKLSSYIFLLGIIIIFTWLSCIEDLSVRKPGKDKKEDK